MKEDDKGLSIFGIIEIALFTLAALLASIVFGGYNVPVFVVSGLLAILIYISPALKRARHKRRLRHSRHIQKI